MKLIFVHITPNKFKKMKKTNVLSNNDQIKRGHKKRKKENRKEDFKIKILNE